MLNMNKNGGMSYCPELLPFSDDIKVVNHHEQTLADYGKLALFETKFLPNDSGGVTFVGGPVSSLQFHPRAEGICAIAAHRADRQTHEVMNCYQGSAHIQLWRFSFDGPSCLALIPHEGDCTWDLKWKPQQLPDDSTTSWSGTLAACLGDGTVMVCHIDPSSVDTFAHGSDTPCILTPKTVLLRTRKKFSLRSPVRVVEWSNDGNLLAAGAADGSIEVFNAKSPERTWPKWSIPGHDSVIMDMRWLSDTHLCSLGLSCVLRLRDIRDPVATLEQNSEGLSGSVSMDALEPNVAVLGADSGFLRIVRLFGTDGVMVRMPVKRVNLQNGPFRDMKSIPVSSNDSKVASQTLLYTGGSEGMLHECKFPRPMWTSPDACHISKTENSEKLRWRLRKATKSEQDCDSGDSTLILQLGKEFATLAAQATGDLENIVAVDFKSSPKRGVRGDPEAPTEDGLHADNSNRKEDLKDRESKDTPEPTPKRSSRKSKAKPRDKNTRDMTYSRFGKNYDQKIVISKIGVSAKSDMIAIGIDGGLVTWLRLDMPFHESLAREQELHEERRKTPRKTQNVKTIAKEDRPPRKRGRPRKMPSTPTRTIFPKLPEITPLDEPKPVSVPAKKKEKQKDKEKREQDLGKNKEENEREKKTRVKTASIHSPRRKRGRPRKVSTQGENANDLGLSGKKRKTKGKIDDPSPASNPATDRGSLPSVNIVATAAESTKPATTPPPSSAALSYIPPDDTSVNPSTATPRTLQKSEETSKGIPPSDVHKQESILQQSVNPSETSSRSPVPIPTFDMKGGASKKHGKNRGPVSSKKRSTETSKENRVSKKRRKQSPGQSKAVSPQPSGHSSSATGEQARIPLPRSTQTGASASQVEKSLIVSGSHGLNSSEPDMNEVSAREGGNKLGANESMDKTNGIGRHVPCRVRVREGVKLKLRMRPERESKPSLQVKLRLRSPTEDKAGDGGVQDGSREENQEQISKVEDVTDVVESFHYDENGNKVKGVVAGETVETETLETRNDQEKRSEKKKERKGETDGVCMKLRVRTGDNAERVGRHGLGQEKVCLKLRVKKGREEKEEDKLEEGRKEVKEEKEKVKQEPEPSEAVVVGRAGGRSTRKRKATWKIQERQH